MRNSEFHFACNKDSNDSFQIWILCKIFVNQEKQQNCALFTFVFIFPSGHAFYWKGLQWTSLTTEANSFRRFLDFFASRKFEQLSANYSWTSAQFCFPLKVIFKFWTLSISKKEVLELKREIVENVGEISDEELEIERKHRKLAKIVTLTVLVIYNLALGFIFLFSLLSGVSPIYLQLPWTKYFESIVVLT